MLVDTKKLWSSRFKKETNELGTKYSESITVDRHMVRQDIWGSQAHTIMLGYTGIVDPDHVKNILQALKKVDHQFVNKEWDLQAKDEDVHMNVERFVIDDVGMDSGGRMHTCRSRNDQVVLDTKLYARDQLAVVQSALAELINTLLELAPEHLNTIMPGYTHTQHAQPMTFAYWLTHYAAIFLRDLERLRQSYDVTNTNPLGAGALTGTSFPINRELTTYLLGFREVQPHCLDAVTARDFTLQILSSLATLFSTISRLAEEIIYGISYEFRTMVLDDSFAMGSSMMPQKKNPGVLELARARAGKVYGILMSMLTMLKGLPSGYNRDYHEDKVNLVEALTLTTDTLRVINSVVRTLTVNKDRLAELAEKNFASATELANYLVRDHNVPFRLCHRVVGYVVGQLVEEGKDFTDYKRTRELLAEKEIELSEAAIKKLLNPADVVNAYVCLGGTAPTEVKRMLGVMHTELAEHQKRMDNADMLLNSRHQETIDIASRIIAGESLSNAVNAMVKDKTILTKTMAEEEIA